MRASPTTRCPTRPTRSSLRSTRPAPPRSPASASWAAWRRTSAQRSPCDAFDQPPVPVRRASPLASLRLKAASFPGRYFNMDQAILNALEMFDGMLAEGKLPAATK